VLQWSALGLLVACPSLPWLFYLPRHADPTDTQAAAFTGSKALACSSLEDKGKPALLCYEMPYKSFAVEFDDEIGNSAEIAPLLTAIFSMVTGSACVCSPPPPPAYPLVLLPRNCIHPFLNNAHPPFSPTAVYAISLILLLPAALFTSITAYRLKNHLRHDAMPPHQGCNRYTLVLTIALACLGCAATGAVVGTASSLVAPSSINAILKLAITSFDPSQATSGGLLGPTFAALALAACATAVTLLLMAVQCFPGLSALPGFGLLRCCPTQGSSSSNAVFLSSATLAASERELEVGLLREAGPYFAAPGRTQQHSLSFTAPDGTQQHSLNFAAPGGAAAPPDPASTY
jgi:hypothetical protein